MSLLEQYFLVMLCIQVLHSIEELTGKFHEKFPLFKLKFSQFLIFEIGFFLFWVTVYLVEFRFRDYLLGFFLVLMFANGVWHIFWAGSIKGYVPGLISSPLLILTFLAFYFQKLF